MKLVSRLWKRFRDATWYMHDVRGLRAPGGLLAYEWLEFPTLQYVTPYTIVIARLIVILQRREVPPWRASGRLLFQLGQTRSIPERA